MHTITGKLQNLFEQLTGIKPESIIPIKQGGSGRQYFRLAAHDISLIGCINSNIAENEAFFHLSHIFRQNKLPVPEVVARDEQQDTYLQSDLGDNLLYDQVINRPEKKLPDDLTALYKMVLSALVKFQTVNQACLDERKFYPLPVFNRQSIQWDLNAFKYYFLNLHDISFNEYRLHNDFDALISFVLNDNMQWFMYRDFQSRNILIHEGSPWFIDFQGGRRGPLAYDVASLLYQAKADLHETDRENLLEYYLEEITVCTDVDHKLFLDYYYPIALIRILQVLGTYGFRGLYQRKSHFLSSIGLALKNLESLLPKLSAIDHLPELKSCMEQLIERKARYQPVDLSKFNLVIKSFSYLNGGMPADISGHGGGYAFDCRMLPNPGREAQYRGFTGLDEPVQSYFARYPEVDQYLEQTTEMIIRHINHYRKRDFDYLSVSFGCTGGQHRSVYCADKTARRIKQLFPDIKIEVHHLMQQKYYIC